MIPTIEENDNYLWRRESDGAICVKVPKDTDPDWIAHTFLDRCFIKLYKYEQIDANIDRLKQTCEAYEESTKTSEKKPYESE